MEDGAGLDTMCVARDVAPIRLSNLWLPLHGRPNLTVLTHALYQAYLRGKASTGVEIAFGRKNPTHHGWTSRLFVSLGAMHTPKVLIQSVIVDEAELRRWGIPRPASARRGATFHDHFGMVCPGSQHRSLPQQGRRGNVLRGGGRWEEAILS